MIAPRTETRQARKVRELEELLLDRHDGDSREALHSCAMLATERLKEVRDTRAYAEDLRRQLLEKGDA